MMGIKTIVWDWNGTLLDDVDICIESINCLLADRGLPLLDHSRYLQVFDFPVQEYYRQIGFDFSKEPFEIPAHQFIEHYFSKLKSISLHKQVPEVLQHFAHQNFQQVILSAAEESKLKEALVYFKIDHFFDDVAGLNDHYAHSKVDIGLDLFHRKSIEKETACLIGDTIHDFEVAKELGCSCILIANGHQAYEKLKSIGVTVVNDLTELLSVI